MTSSVTQTLPVALAHGTELPVAFTDPDLDTPALLVDLDIVEANISAMQAFADRTGVALRPHVKSHKSLAIAGRQLDAGASGLCVATSAEAQLMAASRSADILVAYPLLGTRKLDRLDDLAGDGRLTLVTDSLEVTEGYRTYAQSRGVSIRVMVEVDTGMHRAGATPRGVAEVAVDAARSEGLEFVGIMTHAGHAHDVAGLNEIIEVARAEAATMGDVRAELEGLGLEVKTVSAGSSITSAHFRHDDGITEIRPGTYVYNDLRTLERHACTVDTIAASMLSTVVSTHGTRVTLDAGSKTLTTSPPTAYGKGSIVGLPGASFSRISEEHGVLTVPDGTAVPQVGVRLRILPVHICVWMDLQPEVYGTRGGRVVERIAVEGMRHSL